MQGVEELPNVLHFLGVLAGEDIDGMTGFLKLGGQHLACLDGGNGEGNQGRRNVQLQERAGHGVLAADSSGTQFQLRIQTAQQSGERLAPALRLGAQFLKELLKGQIGLFIICAGGHQLCHGGVHGIVGAGIGVDAGLVGIVPPGHDAGLIGLLTGQRGEQGGHALRGSTLRLAAEGH